MKQLDFSKITQRQEMQQLRQSFVTDNNLYEQHIGEEVFIEEPDCSSTGRLTRAGAQMIELESYRRFSDSPRDLQRANQNSCEVDYRSSKIVLSKSRVGSIQLLNDVLSGKNPEDILGIGKMRKETFKLEGLISTNGKGVTYIATEGFRKTQEHYAEQISQGWAFCINHSEQPCPSYKYSKIPTIRGITFGLEQRGFEVFVGDFSFDQTGKRMDRCKAIFIRRKQGGRQ